MGQGFYPIPNAIGLEPFRPGLTYKSGTSFSHISPVLLLPHPLPSPSTCSTLSHVLQRFVVLCRVRDAPSRCTTDARSLSLFQPSASTTPNSCWPTGLSGPQRSPNLLLCRPTLSTLRPKSPRSSGIPRLELLPQIPVSPNGSSTQNSSRSPINSSSVAARLASSHSTRTGPRPSSGSSRGPESRSRCVIHLITQFSPISPLDHVELQF